MMDCEYLIEIFVPNPEGTGGTIGTGYPIAPNRIITASHVVGDRAAFAKARWYYAPVEVGDDAAADSRPSLRRWINIEPEVPFQDDDLDVAVLNCTFPSGLTEWSVLAESFMAKRELWHSEGFSAAGQRDRHRNAEAFHGVVINDQQRDGTMILGVDYAPSFSQRGDDDTQRESDSLWCGGSGSPVISAGRLAGVVTKCPRDYGAGRLRAVPIATLLKDERFKAAIGYDDRQAWRLRIRQRAERCLHRSTEELVDQLLFELESGGAGSEKRVKCGKAVEALMQRPVSDALHILDRVHDELINDGLSNATDALLMLTRLVLPGLSGITGTRLDASADTSKLVSAAATMVSLPAASPTVAEVLMANSEKRDVRFAEPSLPADDPVSEYMLDDQGLSGAEAGFDSLQHDVLAAIAFLKQNREFVSSDDLRQDHSDDYFIRLLGNEFQACKDEGKTCFFAICLPRPGAERDRLTALIRELKRLFPALTFIRLMDDEERKLDEKSMYRPLRKIYRRAFHRR